MHTLAKIACCANAVFIVFDVVGWLTSTPFHSISPQLHMISEDIAWCALMGAMGGWWVIDKEMLP